MEIKQVGGGELEPRVREHPVGWSLRRGLRRNGRLNDEVLELDLVATGGGAAKKWAHFQLANGSFVELFSDGVKAAGHKSPALQSNDAGLLVPDLDDAMSELKSRGVDVSGDVGSWQDPPGRTRDGLLPGIPRATRSGSKRSPTN